jgi:hypothetical protein
MTRDTATDVIEHQIGSDGRFSLKVADWDLRVTASSDDVVRVRDADGGALPDGLEVNRGAGSLAIRQPNNFRGIGGLLSSRRDDVTLAVEVPANAVVDIHSASGDVTSDGLRGKQLFRTASGDLRLTGEAGDLTAESVSGDVWLGIDDTILLTAKSVSGDVRIEGGHIERLGLSTTSGDARVRSDLGNGPHAVATVSGDVTLVADRGLRITAATLTGDLRSDLPHTSSGGPGRRSIVIGDGSAELQFRSVSGDLRVVDSGTAGAAPPSPPAPPAPPVAPVPPVPPQLPNVATPGAQDGAEAADDPSDDDASDDRLEILRALEAGEIDVAEATDRLAALDGSADD